MLLHSLDSLARCHSAPALVSWMNDRLAEWTFLELASIDEAARPRHIRDVHDIAHWHTMLAENYCGGAALRKDAHIHQRMMTLFAAAYARATELGLFASRNEDSIAA